MLLMAIHCIGYSNVDDYEITGKYDDDGEQIRRKITLTANPGEIFDLWNEADCRELIEMEAAREPTAMELALHRQQKGT